MDLVRKFLECFIPLFVTIDPIGLAAIFLALGRDVPVDKRRRIATQATWTGGIVALLFLLLGRSIFIAIGIGEGDFEIAGGLILFILASRELVQSPSQEKSNLPDDFGVVPLGMPLIAGPATITTLLVISQSFGLPMTLFALAVNLGAGRPGVCAERAPRADDRTDGPAGGLQDHRPPAGGHRGAHRAPRLRQPLSGAQPPKVVRRSA